MDFLKNLLNVFSTFQSQTQPQKPARRSPQIESLESRELLSVNLLGPVTVYAQQDNPAEIRFDLTTSGNTSSSKLDFTVQQTAGSSLDPSAIYLVNRSTGQAVALSNVVNGTISSSASAQLTAGSYSIFVYADAGKGNFALSIAAQEGSQPVKKGLDILVAAAIAQQLQPTSWANQAKYYNGLLANTSYAGAASAMPISKYYPEVDINGDGKINNLDQALAQQLVAENSTIVTINSYSVVAQDLTPPAITVGLKNDTDTPNDKITTDPTIIGKITDVSGIKSASASYKIDNGSWIALSLDASGNYTIPNSGLSYGNHTITVSATDQKGNTASAALTFNYYSPAPPQNISDGGSGKITIASNLKVQSVNGAALTEAGKSVTLPNDQGKITLGNNGLLTYTPSNSFYTKLAKGEKATVSVPVIVKDTQGNEYKSNLSFTLTGVDDPSIISATKTTFDLVSNDTKNPVKEINAGFSVTDPDTKDANGPFVYSYTAKDGIVSAKTGLIADFNSATGTFKIDTTKLKSITANSTVTVVVSVKSVSGDTVSKTLTINFKPVTAPSVPVLNINATETSNKTGKVIPTVAGNGLTTTGLTVVNAVGFGSLPSGVNWASVASLDANGNFTFTPGKYFEYLKLGETLKLKLQYTVTDTQYGLTSPGTIELTITGEVTKPTAPSGQTGNQVIGANGEFNVTEKEGTAPAISVPKNTILAGWTLPDGQTAYSLIPGSATFEKWSGGQTNPLGSNYFGSVNVDAAGNLVFTPASTIYKPLGTGQWIELSVDLLVRDASGATVPAGKVLLRINGTNDAPVPGYQKDSGFVFASNSKSDIVIDPVFTKNDPDLNDSPASLVYSIDDASQNRGFIINASDGKISIANEKAALLNGDVIISVTLSDGHGGTAKKNITVNFYKQAAPVLSSDLILSINEKGPEVSKNLNDTIKNKPVHYSFTHSPLPVKISSDQGKTWTNLSASESALLVGCYQFNAQTGEFKFNPNGQFDYLKTGQTLTVQFEYAASNDDYNNCQSAGSFVVSITGINDSPVPNSSQPVDLGTVTENINSANNPQSKKIDSLLNSWSDADHSNAELKITGLAITGKVGGTLILDKNETLVLFQISNDGRSVYLNLAHDLLRKLPRGESMTLTVGYTVSDPQNGTGTGSFVITIEGEHQPIAFVSKTDVANPVNINEVPSEGKIATVKMTQDIGDSIHRTVTCVGSDGQSYPGLFTIDENGNIFLDPAQRDSLNMNLTYTVTVAITNLDYNDDPITVVYELNFIYRSAPTLYGSSLTLTLLESESKSLDFRNENGSSYKNLTGYDYAITSVNGEKFGDLTYGVDYKIEGGVFYFITGGKFDYLQSGTTETLTFKYEIIDTTQGAGTYSVKGTLTVKVTGENNAPTITGNKTFDVTNSGVPNDNSIFIGHFDIADVDKNDQLTLSAQTVSGTSGDVDLVALPVFRIDENGDVTMKNTDLNLQPGQSATFKVKVEVKDSQGETVFKEITITVYAKKLPLVTISGSGRGAAESDSTISKSYDIAVQDATGEVFTSPRTGNSWYSKPSLTVSVPDAYKNIAGLNNLFTVTGDSINGYQLKFNADASFFDFLQKDEKLVFALTIAVKDAQYLVETKTDLTFTVTGKGSQHTVSMEKPSFDYWTNLKGGDQTTFNPKYTISDPDWKENYTYSVEVNINTLPGGVTLAELQSLIQLNAATGIITLNKTGLDAIQSRISENFVYDLIIRITSVSDGLFQDVNVTFNIKAAEKPVVSADGITVDEGNSISKEIITKPNDGAVRNDSNWYTTETPKFVGYDGNIPAGFNIEEAALAAIEKNIVNGVLQFESGTNFDFLPEGASLVLHYEITVSDTKYDAQVTQNVDVTITGKNSKPDWKEGMVLGTINDGGFLEIPVTDLVDDVDLGDTHTLWKIDNVEVVPGEAFEIAGRGKFQYENGTLKYWATDGELAKLQKDKALALNLDFTVKDNAGYPSDPKTFTINVVGTNKAPVITENLVYYVYQYGSKQTISVNDIATDMNTGDQLYFYQILSNFVTPETTRSLEGAKLSFNTACDTITIDQTNFNWQDNSGLAWGFTIVVNDNFGASSLSKKITIEFLPGVNPEPVDAFLPVTLSTVAAPAPAEVQNVAGIFQNIWTAEDEVLLGDNKDYGQNLFPTPVGVFGEEEERGGIGSPIHDDNLFALDPEVETILAVYQLSV